MIKCPFCNSDIKALPSRIHNRYAGGCDSPKCPVIFRTKELYNKLEAVMTVTDLIRKADR